MADFPRSIAVIVKGWPRLSETFIAQELGALERRGLRLRLFSLRQPTDGKVHAVNRALRAPIVYLPEYLWREPLRVWRGWRRARRLPGYPAARGRWLRDLMRDPTPNRGRRFGQALVLAAEMPTDVAHLYAHFLNTPASVARYAATLRGLPWSASAHAKDIWTTPDWEKREKLAEAQWVVTCTASGRDHLASLARDPARVELVYHGLDAARFPPAERRPSGRDGRDPANPAVLVSVGRAVEKKGYADLLDALARLPPDLHWRLLHVGGGPLLDPLKQQARRLGLDARIEWRGAQDQDGVLRAYRVADLFVLASRVAADGDRDGLPNVLLEALSQGCPVVATAVSAIPELIENGKTGLLVPAGDPPALTAALARLIADLPLRARLARTGEDRVRQEFPLERGIDRLAARFAADEDTATPGMLPAA
ncbi:MAG: glycosyltransferase family 4 protein [Rhodospirillales bacterium]|nr:glycosyltransferase family 4 protein [Rhodospirillales bacterium]